ncbi:MAG: S8 family serine peptidase [Myxococcota bacterium]
MPVPARHFSRHLRRPWFPMAFLLSAGAFAQAKPASGGEPGFDPQRDDAPLEVSWQDSGWGGHDHADTPPPDGILVDLADDLEEGDIAALEQRLGLDLEPTANDVVGGNRYELHGVSLEEARSRLAGNNDVESVEPNVFYGLLEGTFDGADGSAFADPSPTRPSPGKPNDPMYRHQWHFDMVNAEAAWELARGDGVVVAVIDTGVSEGKLADGKRSKFRRVPDLVKTELVPGYNFVGRSPDASDGNGHGTHVAGTIAQSTYNEYGVAGLAYRAKIMPIKVLSDRGFGSVGDIANGIRFAADHGAKVINMSLGGGSYSATLAKAVKYAHDKGVTVVCAAGNGGREKVEYPAAYPGCVAVSALGPDGNLAFYSSYGKETDIAAPGGDTRVDLNRDGIPDGVLQDTIARGDPSSHGFFPFQGTSMATPHVAAAAALVISTGVTDPDRVEEVLQKSARDLKDPIRYGAGGLDAAAAVRKSQNDKGLWALGFATLLSVGGIRRARRRDSLLRFRPGIGFGLALVFGASGFFFLRAFGFHVFPGLALLASPVSEWSSLWLGWTSLSPLVASVLLPLVPVLLFLGATQARGALVGFSYGVAGFLFASALLGVHDVAFVPGHGWLDTAWLSLQGLCAAGLAGLALRRR